MREWISVRDKLPKKLNCVLINVPSHAPYGVNGQTQFVAFLCDWNDEICDEWHIETITSDPGFHSTVPREYVNYWKPLPPPPKSEEQQ